MKMRRESEGTERGALLQPPPPLPAVTVTGSKRIKKGLQVLPSPPLVRWAGGRGRSLTQAGDVGTSARWCHDALGGAAWDVVVDLCARQAKARLVQVPHRWGLLFGRRCFS